MKRYFVLGLVLLAGIFAKPADAAWAQPRSTCDADPCCYPCDPCCMPDCNPCYPSYCGPCDTTYCDPCCTSYSDLTCLDSAWWSGGTYGFFGQFLWMGLYGEGLEYAAVDTHFPVTITPAVWDSSPQTLEHRFDWKPGVRVGCFYQAPCNGPDVAFEWTYYRNNTNDNFVYNAPPTGGITFNSIYLLQLTPSFLITPGTGFLSSVAGSSSASFRFNHFIVKYGDTMNWDCGFSVHPYIGPVYYETNQDINVSVVATAFGTGRTDTQNSMVNTRVQAVGAKIGTDYWYELFDCFALVGDIGLSGVGAQYRLNSNLNTVDNTPVAPFSNFYSRSFKKWQARALFDLSIGFRWGTCICDCFNVFAQVEWEYHQLFNQTSFLTKDMSVPPPAGLSTAGGGVRGFTQSQADLMLHGLSVSLGCAF